MKLGERRGNEVEIAEGLTAHESVAAPVEGEELRDGALVEPRQARP